jgi:hypothetical protein
MPKKRRHRRSVSLPELDDLTPLTVRTEMNHERVIEITQSQAAFGGSARARVTIEKLEGRTRLVVNVMYTSSRVRIGALDEATARLLKNKIRLLSLLNRAAMCEADINADADSEDYLNITLMPLKTQPQPSIMPPKR